MKGSGHGFRTILPNQLQKFGDLAGESAIGVRQASQVALDRFLGAVTGKQSDQAPLGLRALGSRPLGQQLFLEALGAEGLPAPPGANVTEDFLVPVIERHR